MYQARGAATPNQTLIYVHGGGWTGGTKESSSLTFLPFLEMGWNVVNVEYRLAKISQAPAAVDPRLAREAVEIARGVLAGLDVVGVLCVELFIAPGGRLLVNELAPRPHNSGHLTFDACVTSQFEQQLRAVCGLPLGSTEQLRPAAMANLLGDLWARGEPDWEAACGFAEVKLHLYGKADPRPGRKMGHLTALAHDTATALARVVAAREALGREPGGGGR